MVISGLSGTVYMGAPTIRSSKPRGTRHDRGWYQQRWFKRRSMADCVLDGVERASKSPHWDLALRTYYLRTCAAHVL
ncbi:hypothetical protein PUN28_011298 [Cardiocondyla obscurior]|uniref:GIY-YIG homing endonuclease n=1 Tax=Cardiocondyla obscurior TaxID=286306 RepID=A0AAW2FGF6_9HYME